MSLGFSFFGRRSCLLAANEFEAMRATAEVLEQDAHGIKVLRLQNGDILKIFRVKRLVSSAQFYSYARRFCRNALRLAELGIPTVQILQLYHFAGSDNTAVRYAPLPGMTLRELSREGGLDDGLLSRLGAFVAMLHQRGIYFRSLHFGNIVLTPERRLGLIDVADLSIFPWSLSCGRRIRNFRHMRRLSEDMDRAGETGWRSLLESYLRHGALHESCKHRLRSMSG